MTSMGELIQVRRWKRVGLGDVSFSADFLVVRVDEGPKGRIWLCACPVLPDPTLSTLSMYALSVLEGRTISFTEPQDQRAGCATPDRGPDTPATLDGRQSTS